MRLLFVSLTLFIFCSCEKSAEKKFDHSKLPGIYESYAEVKYGIFIPEDARDGDRFLTEIVKSDDKLYTLFFNYEDSRLPDKITVEIYEYHEVVDFTGIRDY